MTASTATEAVPARVDLLWLPLGAGGHVVRWNGRAFEAVSALLQRRPAADLYHSALAVRLDGRRHVIEQAPAWGMGSRERGVVSGGAVGARRLGRWRLFRYEVRCWADGVISDAAEAVDSPVRVPSDTVRARRLLDLVAHVPTATWGRDELGTGEMWNSNSIIAWLLASSGHDVGAITAPRGGRAPGWSAGLIAASRR